MHEGYYEFKLISFGLANAPTFQSLMNHIFSQYLRRFVLILFNDILVYSINTELHESHLNIIFKILEKNQLHINLSKCSFGQSHISYLGHAISNQGIVMDTKKIKVVTQWHIPTNIKELQGFLGLTRYYHKFIKNFGMIARPLAHLLKTNSFKWSIEVEDSFNKLKRALTTTLVLALLNFLKEFKWEVDASGIRIEALLM